MNYEVCPPPHTWAVHKRGRAQKNNLETIVFWFEIETFQQQICPKDSVQRLSLATAEEADLVLSVGISPVEVAEVLKVKVLRVQLYHQHAPWRHGDLKKHVQDRKQHWNAPNSTPPLLHTDWTEPHPPTISPPTTDGEMMMQCSCSEWIVAVTGHYANYKSWGRQLGGDTATQLASLFHTRKLSYSQFLMWVLGKLELRYSVLSSSWEWNGKLF